MMEMVIAMLEGLGCDVDYSITDGDLYVTLNDFEGFDDDWSEVMREYDHPDEVEAFESFLEQFAHEGDLYVIYHLEGFDLELGYTSFDI